MLIKGVPDCITVAVLFLKAFQLKCSQRLIQGIMYLWREFYIKTTIKPIVEKYEVSFKYKDKQFSQITLKSLEELQTIIDEIKKAKGMNIDHVPKEENDDI